MENTEEQVKWLLSILPIPPSIEFLEQSIQTLALFFSYSGVEFEEKDIVVLSLAGHIAMRARISDEEKFLKIIPESYFQVAHYFCDTVYGETEAVEEDFRRFLSFLKLFCINNK
jgi:hypothetical protein